MSKMLELSGIHRILFLCVGCSFLLPKEISQYGGTQIDTGELANDRCEKISRGMCLPISSLILITKSFAPRKSAQFALVYMKIYNFSTALIFYCTENT